MKKKLTLLALGSLLLAGGSTLASCKGDEPSTSSGDISSTTQEVSYTVKVTTPEEKKAWFAFPFTNSESKTDRHKQRHTSGICNPYAD